MCGWRFIVKAVVGDDLKHVRQVDRYEAKGLIADHQLVTLARDEFVHRLRRRKDGRGGLDQRDGEQQAG